MTDNYKGIIAYYTTEFFTVVKSFMMQVPGHLVESLLGATTLSITTFSITTFSITTLSIIGLVCSLNKNDT